MKTTTQHLTNNAAWLADNWATLHHTRLKGTPRRWRQTDLTPEQRAQYDQQHRKEKQTNGAPAGADSPAPLHLDILDQLIKIENDAKTIATTIQATGINAHPDGKDTYSNLRYISQWANVLDDNDETTKAHERTLRHHRRTIESQWAHIVISQRLNAPCPWCGHEQLKFRAIGPEHNSELVVRCESGTCEPPPADCGTWYGGPCWPFHEWEWLVGRIDHKIENS